MEWGWFRKARASFDSPSSQTCFNLLGNDGVLRHSASHICSDVSTALSWSGTSATESVAGEGLSLGSLSVVVPWYLTVALKAWREILQSQKWAIQGMKSRKKSSKIPRLDSPEFVDTWSCSQHFLNSRS